MESDREGAEVTMKKRTWHWVGALCLGAMLLSAAPVSRLAINPIAATIQGGTVKVARTFPGDSLGLPRPRISYVETVTSLSRGYNSGHFCESDGGPIRYTTSVSTAKWNIPWANDCLSDPEGFRWEACWTWHFGVFKFGATCLKETVIK